MSRILWVSNAPWCGSGYGEQTDMFTSRFQEAGHDVAICANHGLSNKPTVWNGMPVFPQAGEDSIQTFAKHTDADIVILLYDTWVMHPDQWPEVHMAMWTPVDHWPVPPEVLAVINHERVRPIAMSRFGEKLMRDFDKDPAFNLEPLYVPHGVDTEVFTPMPGAREDLRDRLGIPQDAFLVGMVAANAGWNPQLSRKSFPQAFDAVGRFMKQHDDVHFYVHSRLEGAGRGHDLVLLRRIMEIPEDRFFAPTPNAWHLGLMDKEFVSGVYNTFDVLLNPSMGEGFGIPIVEAQACGVPVITSDHSAMPELTRAGWMVDGDRFWDGTQSSFAFIPFVQSIVERLELAYYNRDNQELHEAAREFALAYDADRVMEHYWTPVLDELAKPREIKPLNNGKVTRQQRRAAEREAAKRG